MPRQEATQNWSDPIELPFGVRAQAEKSRIAVYLGSDTPDDSYLVMQPDDTVDIPPGFFRIRSVEAEGGALRWQVWSL